MLFQTYPKLISKFLLFGIKKKIEVRNFFFNTTIVRIRDQISNFKIESACSLPLNKLTLA